MYIYLDQALCTMASQFSMAGMRMNLRVGEQGPTGPPQSTAPLIACKRVQRAHERQQEYR